MAAVTANQITRHKGAGGLIAAKASNVNLYAGTLAYSIAASGFITGDDANGANPFMGIVKEQVDNSGGSAGDLDVELYTEGVFYLSGSSLTQALVGDAIYGIDNATVQASSTNASRVGTCVEFVSATEIGVKLLTNRDITP